MMLKITDDLSVTRDQYQFILGKPVTRKDGNTEIKNAKYYPRLEHLFMALCNTGLENAGRRAGLDVLCCCIADAEERCKRIGRAFACNPDMEASVGSLVD